MEANTQHSPFLALPLELRQFVFEKLFSAVVIKPRVRGTHDFRDIERAMVTNIFLVSRQMHKESVPLYWKHCLFDFSQQLKRNTFESRDSDPAGKILKMAHIPTKDFYKIQRIYGGEELLHCLDIMPKDTFRLQMGRDIFPGLEPELLQIRELTVEYWIHEVQLNRSPDQLMARDRNGLSKLLTLRTMQNDSLPYNLYLRVVYWSDGERLPPNQKRKYNYDDKSDWPMFDISTRGQMSRLNGEPNLNGVHLLEQLINLLNIDCNETQSEIESMRERAENFAHGLESHTRTQ